MLFEPHILCWMLKLLTAHSRFIDLYDFSYQNTGRPGSVLMRGTVRWNAALCEMLSGSWLRGQPCYNRRDLRACATVRVAVTCFAELDMLEEHLELQLPKGHYQWGTTWQHCEGVSKTSEIKSAKVHILICMVLSLTAWWLIYMLFYQDSFLSKKGMIRAR